MPVSQAPGEAGVAGPGNALGTAMLSVFERDSKNRFIYKYNMNKILKSLVENNRDVTLLSIQTSIFGFQYFHVLINFKVLLSL